MPREAPAVLADEIATSRGPWLLANARMRYRRLSAGVSSLTIEIEGRHMRSEVVLSRSPAAGSVAAALKRSGYQILRLDSVSLQACRPLHGSRELDAELRRLQALAGDSASAKMWPPRRSRLLSLALAKVKGQLAHVDLRRLRNRHGWSTEWVSAGRKGPPAFLHAPGWTAGAWCGAYDDGDDRRLEMHVQLFSKSASKDVDSDELARLTRRFRSHLLPLGYRALKINGGQGRPQFAVFEKDLPTLAVARRERSALDRALFGD